LVRDRRPARGELATGVREFQMRGDFLSDHVGDLGDVLQQAGGGMQRLRIRDAAVALQHLQGGVAPGKFVEWHLAWRFGGGLFQSDRARIASARSQAHRMPT
jgi:hypothetical protein